jgi:hypothetical protein
MDRDGMLSRKEAAVLATSIQVDLSAYGVVFDVDTFHRAVGVSPSLVGIVAMVKKLIPDQDGKRSSFYSVNDTIDKSIATVDDKEDGLFDMFYMPVRRAFETMFTDRLYSVKDNVQAPTYMSLAPASPRSSISLQSAPRKLLENVAACPECSQCPYCITKPKNDSTVVVQKSCAHGKIISHYH